MKQLKKARLMLIASMTIFGTIGLFVRYIPVSSGELALYRALLAAILTLIPYVALTGGVTLNRLNGSGWIFLLIVGLVHTGITYCMYFSALKELPGQKAAILSYIDPLVAVLVSVLILREPLTLWQTIGGLLILGFTLWNEIDK